MRIDTPPMDDRITTALGLLPEYLSQHVLLSAAALALGVAVSLPLAVAASRRPRLRWPLLAMASLVQTIPGLALLALFYPILLGLSSVTAAGFGFSLPALGFLPSLSALTLYAMLPILRNSIAALAGIDPVYIEAADGVGMTPRQRFFQVEVPLAAPVIMGGIRTAAVWTIGAATLSTTVGQTSLGNFIFSGLQTENWISVVVGCAAAVALALAADQLLALVEAAAVRRDRRRVALGLAGLSLGTLAALAPLASGAARVYTVGAKNFTEQFILADLMAVRLERTGARVQRKSGLGSAVIFRALAGGDIDVYVDYSGTLWTNVMRRRDTPSRDVMLREITRWMAQRHGVTVLGALGFENAYALAMRQDRAAELGIGSIADLAPVSRRLTLGSDLEFLGRPEWAALRRAYGLDFQAEKSFNPTFMYRAVANGDIDVISAFSSDGRIAADKLLVLDDVKHAVPAYDAVILISPKRTTDDVLRRALLPLVGAIPVERMREANLMVDSGDNKASLEQAVRFLARSITLSER